MSPGPNIGGDVSPLSHRDRRPWGERCFLPLPRATGLEYRTAFNAVRRMSGTAFLLNLSLHSIANLQTQVTLKPVHLVSTSHCPHFYIDPSSDWTASASDSALLSATVRLVSLYDTTTQPFCRPQYECCVSVCLSVCLSRTSS